MRASAFLSRAGAWIVALALVALPIVGVVQGWFGEGRWPLRNLEIEGGLVRLTAVQVRDALGEEAQAGFFSVHLDRVRTGIERLPGVRRVEVRRRWPETLIVRVLEREPVAAFGADRLIDADGVVFGPFERIDATALPRLDAPIPEAGNALAQFRACSAALATVGMNAQALVLSARGGLSLTLDQGEVIDLGRDDTTARLQRFVDVWTRLPRPEGATLERADLRHANGFAIAWRPAVAPEAAPPAAPTSDGLPPAPAPDAPADTTATPEPTDQTANEHPLA